ncbi:hypothetical protein LN451_18145 [Xanthomonas hortorum pv. gardneri]|uniref:hypothetical protein n=1 Tax=Xanthomonas hortorum TaxID=56454 RepID=UPI001E3F6383|nr:hypothetical protein [Xanthomonas hortorum]MCC8495800.1 hypothetical protein [Xanthomonas hortorum pv. gardneri]MCE4530223.1 hypothetical protein [Xanthomonas hortorum pv. vitians]
MSRVVPGDDLADALTALGSEYVAGGRCLLEGAAQQGSIMGRALNDVLNQGGSRNAYDEPRAFEVFIRGGETLRYTQRSAPIWPSFTTLFGQARCWTSVRVTAWR